VLGLVRTYQDQIEQNLAPKYVHGRLKQWLYQLKREYAEAGLVFEKIKTLKEFSQLREALK
jgi:tRNA-dihydrouridine synthase C